MEWITSCLTTWNMCILAITLTLIWLYRHFTTLQRYGIPGPRPWPFFGSLLEQLRRGTEVTDREWIEKYGKLVGYYSGSEMHVLVCDPVLVKSVMIKDFQHFMDRPWKEGLPKLFQDGLFMMRGQRWKQTRNILTPSFSAGKLKQFIPILNKNAETLVKNMTKRYNEVVEIRKFYKHFTMDAICSTAFGIDIDSQNSPKDPFVTNIEPVLSLRFVTKIIIVMADTFPLIGKLLPYFGFSRFPEQSVQFYKKTGQMLIDERKKNTSDGVDFIRMMMSAEFDSTKFAHMSHGSAVNGKTVNSGNGHTANGPMEHIQKLSDDEVNATAFLFFLAGFETTASVLRYASYILSLRPDLDKKLCDEIEKRIGNDTPDYDQIASLSFMDMFIDEVLRMFPPVTRLNRVVYEDVHLGSITIPKGSHITIPVYYIHHHPDNYPEPEKFIPERFSPENKAALKGDGLTYLPFGEGPRHCIGMRLALVEAKIALVHVLRKVRFTKCEKTQVPLKLTHVDLLRPKEEIHVRVDRR